MSNPPPGSRETIGHLLQALEHLLEGAEGAATMANQLIRTQRTGKPLAPPTLAHYEQQLATFDEQRRHFRTLIGQWWTLLETEKH